MVTNVVFALLVLLVLAYLFAIIHFAGIYLLDSLFEILSDADVMKYYPKPFDAERVKGWIEWNLQNYKQ